MHVVYDTMLFFQVAAQQPLRLHGTFQAVDAGRVRLCMSEELFSEILEVLSRREFLEKAPHFSPDLASRFFAKLRSVSTWFESIPKVFTLANHTKDDHLFNLAIAAGADRLVTWEKRLLTLQEQGSPDGQRLRILVPHMRIVSPKELLAELNETE